MGKRKRNHKNNNETNKNKKKKIFINNNNNNNNNHNSNHKPRNKKRKLNMNPNKKNQKKYKKQKFWIQNCQELKPQKHQLVGAMAIIITRSDIRDDFVAQTHSLTSIADEDKKERLGIQKESNMMETNVEEDVEASNTDEQNIETEAVKMKTNKSDIEVIDEFSNCNAVNNNTTNDAFNNNEEEIQKRIETLEQLSSQLITKMDGVDEQLLTKEQIDQFHQIKFESNTVSTSSNNDSNENNKSDTPTSLSSNQKEREYVDDHISLNTITSSTNATSSKPDLRLPFIRVIRSETAKKKVKGAKKLHYQPHLPNGDCGDGIINPYPNTEVADKYWAQRKRLFSKFDEGILLDKESWYSVTPEAIANHLAKRIINFVHSSKTNNENDCSDRGKIILDPFCGCGGNVIAFARNHGANSKEISLTVCVDHDLEKLRMAATNASIYNIDVHKIIFIHADATFVMKYCYQNGENILNENHDSIDCGYYYKEMEHYKGYKIGGVDALPKYIDAIFLSPPWGGPDYLENGGESTGFHIKNNIQITSPLSLSMSKQSKDSIQESNEAIDGEDLLNIAANASNQKKVVLFLPRNLDGISFGRVALKAGYRGNLEMEQNILNGKLKTITVYLGKDNTDLLGSST